MFISHLNQIFAKNVLFVSDKATCHQKGMELQKDVILKLNAHAVARVNVISMSATRL